MTKPSKADKFTIEYFWQTFYDRVISKTTFVADPAALRILHWTFFGGAHVILEVCANISTSDIIEEDAQIWLERLTTEDNDFLGKVSRGEA